MKQLWAPWRLEYVQHADDGDECVFCRAAALPEDLELYFDDIVDASERIWDLLDNYKEVVEALEDTNESLISHQQNDILYVLTVFSVVMLPLTFLTGFFGMNVHFPGFETWDAFWASLGLMAVAIVGMLAFFRLKRWL